MSLRREAKLFTPNVGDVVLVRRKYGWMPAQVRRVYPVPCVDVGDGDLVPLGEVTPADPDQQIKFLRERLAELERTSK